MHLISISCVVVLVIESIIHVVFLTASQFWHHLLKKNILTKKMLFQPTIPSFFSLKHETHIFFFFLPKIKRQLSDSFKVNTCAFRYDKEKCSKRLMRVRPAFYHQMAAILNVILNISKVWNFNDWISWISIKKKQKNSTLWTSVLNRSNWFSDWLYIFWYFILFLIRNRRQTKHFARLSWGGEKPE